MCQDIFEAVADDVTTFGIGDVVRTTSNFIGRIIGVGRTGSGYMLFRLTDSDEAFFASELSLVI